MSDLVSSRLDNMELQLKALYERVRLLEQTDDVYNHELSPVEAVYAMLNGEILDRGFQVIERYNSETKRFQYKLRSESQWTDKPMDGQFVELRKMKNGGK